VAERRWPRSMLAPDAAATPKAIGPEVHDHLLLQRPQRQRGKSCSGNQRTAAHHKPALSLSWLPRGMWALRPINQGDYGRTPSSRSFASWRAFTNEVISSAALVMGRSRTVFWPRERCLIVKIAHAMRTAVAVWHRSNAVDAGPKSHVAARALKRQSQPGAQSRLLIHTFWPWKLTIQTRGRWRGRGKWQM
jgi:hypothetical protein